MEKQEIKIEVDHEFINDVIKKARQCANMLRIINIFTFGIFKDRINFQYETLERIVSEAIEASITVK